VNTKALSGLKITDESKGEVEAVFATLDVIDSDGDVTVKGAFDDGAAVRISAYNHKSWKDALPVGRGTIHEVGDQAILKGQFFLATQHGRDTFETIKAMGELQEWSYGFDTVDSERGMKDDQSVQFLKKLKVHEVSPVMLGAGVDTRTLAVKGGQKLSEHAAAVLADVDALVTRAVEVKTLRSEHGKGLGEETTDLLAQLEPSLKRLREVLTTAPPEDNDLASDATREWLRALRRDL